MKKINNKIISIPPYISTSWENISSLHVKEKKLIISLINGEIISIPEIEQELLDSIFDSHSKYLEEQVQGNNKIKERARSRSPFSFLQNMDSTNESPFKFGVGGLDNFGAMMQHNSSQSNSPDLPPEVLNKIRSIAKIIAPEDQDQIPKPEPHCNCMHCQIAGAIYQGLGITDIYSKDETIVEEEVSDDELNFQQWEIVPSGEKLFIVINRLDSQEKYNVFLGNPVGCTCGKSGCEHILAVLKS